MSLTATRPVTEIREQIETTATTGYQRTVAGLRHQETSERHQDVVRDEWEVRSATRTRLSAVYLLTELSTLGFAWRDVARMVGVSVPAVQKWRKGEGVSGANRKRLAQLVAGCDLIAEHGMVDDVASWFEIPLVPDAPVTAIDLWSGGASHLVFEYALDRMTAIAVLDEWDGEWRERFRSDHEVAVADDGQRYLRPTEG